MPPADPHTIARTVVERCWSEPAGVERMRALLADGYVHHSPFGDWTFAQFVAGLEWVESQISARTYRVGHVVCEGDLVAAFFEWDGTRVADGSAVEGRGAYHFRLAGGLIGEDWDVFFPAG